MADLNDLNLSPTPYTTDIDFDHMPTGIGGTVIEPPQPGIYVFRLPSAPVLSTCFEKIEPGQTNGQWQRLAAVLRDAAALHNVTLNQPYNARLTNVIRYLTRRGQEEKLAISDLAQLLKSVGSLPSAQSNLAYALALVAAADREFVAENTLSATCNPARDTYRLNENTGRSEQTTIKGCGQKFKIEGYTPKDGGRAVYFIPRDEAGKLQLRFTCPCGAEIRAWGNLQGFRPSK